MKRIFATIISVVTIISCNDPAKPKEEKVVPPVQAEAKNTIDTVGQLRYNAGNTECIGFAAYSSDTSNKKPVIIIVPEWWGVTDYTRMRAKMFAEEGFTAVVADFYGNGTNTLDAKEAGKLAGQFYPVISLAAQRFDAAVSAAKKLPGADTSKVFAVGYCFGGSMVLNMAKIGKDLQAVVSFHGGLMPAPPVNENTVKARILVCNGAADSFVSADDIAKFKKELDSVHVSYKFIDYADAKHAFTNPKATEVGKAQGLDIAYNEAADKKSWMDAISFLKNVK